MADPILGVTAKGKDELSGPVEAAAKAFADAAAAVDTANAKVVRSEREKREAMKAAREAMKLAQQQAADMSLAVSGLSGAVKALAAQSGLSVVQMVQLGAAIKALEFGGSVALGAIRDLAGGVKEATKQAAEFDYRMAEASTLVDTAKVPMGDLSKFVRELAGQYAQSPITEAKALYQAISAGAFTAAEATAIMTTANRLAVAGVTDVFTAVDGLTNVVNAWGASMTEAETYANTFFVAMRDGKTTVPQLASAIGSVAGTARQAGLTFKETAAAIAAITTSGISTDEAVTALNNALQKILKPSKEARQEAARLGIEFNTAGIQAKGGFAPFLLDITRNAKLTSESVGRLFGNVRGIKGAFALAVNDGEKFNTILHDMENQSGAVDEGIAKISATVQFQAQRFEALRQVAATTLGELVTKNEGVAGALEGVNVAMTSFVGLLMRSSTEAGITRQEASKLVREGFAALAEAAAVLLSVAPDMSGWFTAVANAAIETVPPLKGAGQAIALVVGTVNELRHAKEELAKYQAENGGSNEEKKQAEETKGAYDGAIKKLREFAAQVRSGKEDVEAAAEADKKATEARAKDLERLKELYKNLQDARAESADAKQAAKDEKEAHAERVRQVRADLAELDRIEREKKKAKKDADREFNALVIGDLKLQETEAKARGARMKAEREANDRAEIAAEERMISQRKAAADALKGIAGTLFGGFKTAFSQILSQEKSFGDAMLAMAGDIAAQLAETLIIRGIGHAIDTATAGLGGGALGLLGKIFGFAGGGVVGRQGQPVRMAEGGMITGGTPGQDSVPVLAMPEEAFLPRGLVRELRRVLAVPAPNQASFAAGGVVGAGAGYAAPAPIIFAPTLPMSVPMTRAQAFEHFDAALLPALEQLHRSGRLDFLKPPRR